MSKKLKFHDLPPGAYFRWQTLLGAGDTFLKVSQESILNVTLRSRRPRNVADAYFANADPVRIVPRP